MIRKHVIMVGILLLVVTSGACQKNKNLFEQRQEDLVIVEKTEKQTKEPTNAPHTDIQPDKKPMNAPPTDIVPTKEQAADKLNSSTENEPEGDTMATLGQNELVSFYYEEITEEIKARIAGKSYGDTCDVPYEELRYVKVLHWGFDGVTHTGELIVNKSIAEDILEIFKELFELEYPIERMVLVDEYDADDNASMAANNSSAFNYRKVDGTDRVSLHSYGIAIDINPLYNPYVREVDGETIVTPVNGAEYEDRSLECSYYINKGDPCYQIFTEHGFTWGGEWKNSKDYQHFQKVSE